MLLLLKQSDEEIATGKPTPPPPPPVHGVCDYDINETAILGAGWTKSFDENFSSNLNNWNTWYGGAFNNELQLYQAANLSVTNGNLVISARKETVSGPTTPFDATPKTFNYTSGRIESKTNFSASCFFTSCKNDGKNKIAIRLWHVASILELWRSMANARRDRYFGSKRTGGYEIPDKLFLWKNCKSQSCSWCRRLCDY